MKGVVLYDTKYGNTRLAAEWIAEGMRATDVMQVAVSDIKQFDIRRLAEFDLVLIGAPVHFGMPSRTITRFIDRVGSLGLRDKRGAVFDTYLRTDFEKGVKAMEARILDRIPGLKLVVPGLSVRVDAIKGPITDGELPKCVDFGKRVAAPVKDSQSPPAG